METVKKPKKKVKKLKFIKQPTSYGYAYSPGDIIPQLKDKKKQQILIDNGIAELV